jgi:hypothetical protein
VQTATQANRLPHVQKLTEETILKLKINVRDQIETF